jgi:LuxR family transcriptional regulator, maltose regulon positive regulatory protein
MIGDVTQSISAAFIRSNIAVVQGRLRMAEETCLNLIKQVTRYSQSSSPPVADLHVGLSEIKREHNDLSAAAGHLATSEALGEQGGIAEYRHRWFIADARLREAQGDLSGALESLNEAQRQYLPSPDPDVRPFAAMKTRIWIKQDQIGEALRWAQERGLTIHDELTYPQEYEHITLARLLIAQHQNEKRDESIRDAEVLLERLAHAAEAGGRNGSLIEILVLRAIACETQGNVTKALKHLGRAMQLAEPEGYVRVFIDEGAPIGRLLQDAVSKGIMPDYAQSLLTALEGSSPGPAAPIIQPLIEPLTAREREILQLIAQGLSNRQICDQLFLSLNTVKGHNRIIFSKLQVERRTEAVARARELGLI